MRFIGRMILLCVFICLGSQWANSEQFNFKSEGDVQDISKFMKFRNRLDGRIGQSERNNLKFSIGEYYFKSNDFRDAKESFRNYSQENTAGVDALLASIYLYKLAELTVHSEDVDAIKQEIFKDQFILLFDKFKTLRYISLFGNEYEVRYYRDRIEVFLNGTLFVAIEP